MFRIVVVGCIILSFCSVSKATSIVIDPANAIGIGPYSSVTTFNDFNGTSLLGQSLSLDIVFANSKYIFEDSPMHNVVLGFSSTFVGNISPFLLPGSAYFLGIDGSPITHSMAFTTISGTSHNGSFSFLLYTGVPNQPNPATGPLKYYGVHLDFAMPSLPGATISSARLMAQDIEGVGVPEPSSFSLITVSLISVSLAALIGKFRASRTSP